ncbi:fibroblast growth factor receptor 3-like [Ptychodera flava]|uniref:fibroblast growth factor receptor 3-like n=1 Tax=Ptychodera flava TaxID=63121 RepID=UPI00396A8A1A
MYRGSRLVALREDIQDPYTGRFEVVSEEGVYNLRILYTALDDGGAYECTDVGNRTRQAVAFLYVIANVTKCTVKNDSTVIAGDDVSFICLNQEIILDNNAPGDLVWYNNGKEVSRTSRHSNIWSTTLYKDDNGAVFSCQLEHYTLPPSKWSELACEDQIIMDVQFSPSVKIMSSAAVTMEDSSLTLACVIDANPNDVVYSWILADGSVNGGAVIDIGNVTRDLHGNQSCTATNSFYDGTQGSGIDVLYLEVQYTATVNMSVQPSNEVTEGSCVRITCSMSDGNPDPYKLKLTLDSHELIAADRAELTYEIKGFGTNDIGFYRCQAVTLFFDGTEGFSEVGQEIKMKMPRPSSNTGTVLFIVFLVILVPGAALIGILLSSFYWKRKLKDKGTRRAHDSKLDLKEDEYEHYTSITRRIEGESVYMKLGERSSFEVLREFLYLRETLADGAFARFVKAEAWNIAGREGVSNVVVKILKERPLDVDKVDFLKEIDLMKSIGTHPNIVSLLDCCTEYEPFYMIMEFMEGGNLQGILRNNRSALGSAYTNVNISNENKTLTSADLVTFAHQVSSGMEYLASRECVHRNLAARNVLLDKNIVCKIYDFGLALGVVDKPQYERKTKGKLTIRWMAMESIKDGVFTTKSDVWSFGVVLWEIVTMGNIPYQGMSEQEVTSSLREGYRMPKPSHCEKELYSTILSCWDKNPEKRPTFSELTAILQKMANDEKTYIKIMDIGSISDD